MFDERDVLLKAAERITEEGMWCQGAFFLSDDQDLAVDGRILRAAFQLLVEELRIPECALGAIASATVALGLGESAYDAAQHRLWDTVGQFPPTFNDTQGRTAHEVAEAMRTAAL